jgi:flagellar hook assembly protein FlgD
VVFDLIVIGHLYNIMNMRRVAGIIALVAGCLWPGLVTVGAQTGADTAWEKLTRVPLDTLDARDTRVWMGLHLPSTCKTQVSILDSASRPCRLLINRLMSTGYYNAYWDKRDDSGRFVAPGRYMYVVTPVCGEVYKGSLKVHYKKWEREVGMRSNPGSPPSMTVTIDSAAAPINLLVYTWNGNLIDTICVDSVFACGSHPVEWKPKTNFPKGQYWMRLRVGEFETKEKFWR